MNTLGKIKKLSVLVAFLAMLLPSAVLANFYDEEEGEPGVIPDNPGAITDAICGNNPGLCGPVIIHDENVDVALVPNVNGDSNAGNPNNNPPPPDNNPPPSDNNSPPPSDNDSLPQEQQVSSGNDSAPQQDVIAPVQVASVNSQVLAQDPTKKQVLGRLTILTETTVSSMLKDTVKQPDVVGFGGGSNSSPQVVVQLANPSASPAANQAKAVDVLDSLSAQVKDSKVAASTTKSPIIADIVTNKTNAFSTSSAFVVAQSAFAPGSNSLTPQATQLFSSIKLNSNDVVTVVGSSTKAAAVVTELQKNGVSADQIKILPTAGANTDTVAVSVERLAMLPDIFNP